MTSKVSITDKLKTFEVSPSSSQDFEASQNEFDSSEDILKESNEAFPSDITYSEKEKSVVCGKSSKPITSTQFHQEKGNDASPNGLVESPNDFWESLDTRIIQNADKPMNSIILTPPIASNSEQFNTNISSSVNRSKELHKRSSHISFPTNEKRRKDVGASNRDISPSSPLPVDEKHPTIDADQIIELVTGISANDLEFQGSITDVHSSNRQFPGPAGILPRLHTGVESNPGLANIMRLHRGSDLKKFSVADPKPSAHHRVIENLQSGDNSRLDRSEYIENNELWLRMLSDDKLAAEGYHELMENFNIEFIKKSGEEENFGDTNNTGLGKNQIGCITRTPLLIAAVKAVDLARGHQDPTCQLIDRTGIIYGQFSSEIIQQYGSRIHPGTVLVLRNMAILATTRNIYVNITLSNLIALFWLSSSNDSALSRTSSIFGKRICRVTKKDILRDAKTIEEEAKAEMLAQKSSLQSQTNQAARQNYARNVISSSTESVASTLRSPVYSVTTDARNRSNFSNYVRNPTPPNRPVFQPRLSSSPSPVNINNYTNPTTQNKFRKPSMPWKDQHAFQRERPNSISPRFTFKPSSSSSPCHQKENYTRYAESSSSNSSHLLEGLDEDSIFGDF